MPIACTTTYTSNVSQTNFFSLPQVARAGRFGTKGLAITFVSDEADAKVLNDVQDRFEVNIGELPQEIDITSYSKYPTCSTCHPLFHLSSISGRCNIPNFVAEFKSLFPNSQAGL